MNKLIKAIVIYTILFAIGVALASIEYGVSMTASYILYIVLGLVVVTYPGFHEKKS